MAYIFPARKNPSRPLTRLPDPAWIHQTPEAFVPVEIHCPVCQKKYGLSPDSLARLTTAREVPCPACGGGIPLQPGPLSPMSKEKLIKEAGALPPMPEILIRARAIVESPYADVRDLAEVLEKDQAMTTRLLKLANSAYYGLRHPAESAHKACLVLGEQTLLQMITLVSTSKLFSHSLEGYDLDAATIFSHALFVAIVSKKICGLRFREFESSAFSAGLLHDAGMLILDSHIRKRKDAYQSLRSQGFSQHGAEKALLGFDHAEIGHDFCINWKVPEDQALAIHWHHEPEKGRGKALAHVLHAADILSWQDPDRLPSEDIRPESFARIALSDEELHTLRTDAWQDVAQIVADILIP